MFGIRVRTGPKVGVRLFSKTVSAYQSGLGAMCSSGGKHAEPTFLGT